MKLKGIALTLEMGIVLSMVAILCVTGVSLAGLSWYKNYQSDLLRDKCNQLEFAVRLYGQNHRVVDTASENYDSDGNLHYNMLQTYPPSQSSLADLHKLGFLQTELKISDFQWSLSNGSVTKDNTKVFYTVNDDFTQYRIEVTLPNGSKYITPGSSSF